LVPQWKVEKLFFPASLGLGTPERWANISPTEIATEAPGFTIQQLGRQRVQIELRPSFIASYSAANNNVERAFAAALAASLLEAAGLNTAAASEHVASFLNQVAPLGPKRMLHKIDSRNNPAYIDKSSRRPRYVQDFDTHCAASETTRSLRENGVPAGTIRDAGKIANMMQDAVGHHYRALQAIAHQCKAEEVIPALLERNEALVAEEAEQQLTLASQIACYETSAPTVDRLKRDTSRNVKTAIATRFLVEYFAARQPSGLRPFSNSYLDELTSIACEIFSLGTIGDICHYRLADVQLVVLPNGYNVVSGAYGDALDSYSDFVAQALLANAQKNSLPEKVSSLKPQEADALDQACLEEFGAPMTEIMMFFGEAISIAAERSAGLFQTPRAEFVNHLVDRLSWSSEKVVSVLTHFALSQRDDFLKPASPFVTADVFPWRFNRALSYLRRPFVQFRSGSSENIAYTPGFLSVASGNLVGLCLQGRLKASCGRMKQFMSRFLSAAANNFNDEVHQAALSLGYISRLRVNKIGKVRLAETGKDIGDIDVLVVDRYKKRIWLLECKDFSLARTPAEVWGDLNQLFIDSEGRLSAQSKHGRRVRWIQDNLPAVLASLELPVTSKWKVSGAFVFSQRLISPLLARVSFPLWTLDEFRSGKAL
jgi:hypothetical protein